MVLVLSKSVERSVPVLPRTLMGGQYLTTASRYFPSDRLTSPFLAVLSQLIPHGSKHVKNFQGIGIKTPIDCTVMSYK
jgi:hypothetical protein